MLCSLWLATSGSRDPVVPPHGLWRLGGLTWSLSSKCCHSDLSDSTDRANHVPWELPPSCQGRCSRKLPFLPFLDRPTSLPSLGSPLASIYLASSVSGLHLSLSFPSRHSRLCSRLRQSPRTLLQGALFLRMLPCNVLLQNMALSIHTPHTGWGKDRSCQLLLRRSLLNGSASMGLGWGPLCFSGSIGLVISSTLETQCQLPLPFSYPGVSVYAYLATVGVPMRTSTLGWEPRQGYPAGSRRSLSFAFGPLSGPSSLFPCSSLSASSLN